MPLGSIVQIPNNTNIFVRSNLINFLEKFHIYLMYQADSLSIWIFNPAITRWIVEFTMMKTFNIGFVIIFDDKNHIVAEYIFN